MAAREANEEGVADNRRHRRVRVNLFGRYMLADGREADCRIVDMSLGGIAVEGLERASAHERVVVYVDQLGRLEATEVRSRRGGFAATITATPRKFDKLVAQLTWLANRDLLGEDHTRRHERVAPCDPRSALTMPDGTWLPCAVLEMSGSGAAIASAKKPAVGTLVTIGRIQSRVTRHIDVGFVVEFTRLRIPSLLEDTIGSPYVVAIPA